MFVSLILYGSMQLYLLADRALKLHLKLMENAKSYEAAANSCSTLSVPILPYCRVRNFNLGQFCSPLSSCCGLFFKTHLVQLSRYRLIRYLIFIKGRVDYT